jgi:hypothetical protein
MPQAVRRRTQMKKVRTLAGLAVMAPAAAALAPATGHAATVSAADHGTSGKTVSLSGARTEFSGPSFYPIYKVSNHLAPLWTPSNHVGRYMNSTVSVWVSCYYSGNTGFASDKYWDHVTEEVAQVPGGAPVYSFSIGHVADHFVNLGGRFPAAAKIPKCS